MWGIPPGQIYPFYDLLRQTETRELGNMLRGFDEELVAGQDIPSWVTPKVFIIGAASDSEGADFYAAVEFLSGAVRIGPSALS